MGEIRVQDEQGIVHVFPDGSTPEMIAQVMKVKPPSSTAEFSGASLNQSALAGMTGMPSAAFNPQQKQEFEEGKASGSLATPGGGLVTAGSGVGDVTRGDFSKGGHKIIQGGMTMAMPLMPEAAIARPVMALRAVAGGYLASKAAQAAAKSAGANEEQQQFAGDLGNLAGGFAAASGLPRALFESAAKSAMNKVATSVSGSLDPDVVGLISPRLAHLMRVAGKVAEVTKATTEGTAAGPVSGEPPLAEAAPSPYRLSGKQIQDATTVTPRRILGPERQLPAATESAQAAKPSSPDYKVPNATYLRPEMRSLSQQPPTTAAKPNLLAGIREHEFLMKVQDELNRQGGDEQAQKEIDDWIEAHNRKAPGAKPQSAADVMKAKFNAARAQAESKANAVPSDEAPTVAYRVRDVGETGIMPRGHAQATTDLPQAQSYVEGRGSAQKAPQEVVKVDLSKLKPSEYTLKTGPGGKTWVQFKSAVPESFIEKVGEEPRVPTSDADMENLLMKSIQSVKLRKAAKAGD